MEELTHCVESRGVEILGVQEHRRVHEDINIKYHRVESYTFVTSSAWRNEAQAATGGVGLLLSPRARKALRKTHPFSERILIAEFGGNPVTTIMAVYSPTNVSSVEDAEKFYRDLATAVRSVPAHNFLAILGDFNARLGQKDAPYTFHEDTNRNGTYLAALLLEQELLAANTMFRKRTGKRWTFQDRPTGMRRQLDYILVRRKWRNSVLNAEPYNTFNSVGSDHRVVSMRVRLSLRVPKPTPRVRYDWRAFSANQELQARYAAEFRDHVHIQEVKEDPSAGYIKVMEAHVAATAGCVPVVQKTRGPARSKHPDVISARQKVEEAHRVFDQDPSAEQRETLKEAKQRLFAEYDKIKGEELMQKVHRVEAAHGEYQYSESWKVINEMCGRKRPKEGQVAGNSPEERVNTWFTHFRNLLGTHQTVEGAEMDVPAVLGDLNIDDGPFTSREFAEAKASLRQGKSAGPDGIPPEVIKHCNLDDFILEICNQALVENIMPEIWSLSHIIPVPKSGDLSKPDNYRGISLTCIIAKTFNRMILNRLRSAIDPHLRENQNGFREGRTTLAQILALRRIIEEVKRNNLSAVLCFIDFRKAFDSVHRGMMMKILKAYDVPPNLLRAIGTMYTGTRAQVTTPDGSSEEFNIQTGVLQGDTLAPFLFIIVLDYALRQAMRGKEQELGFTITPRRSTRHPAQTLTDLDYADDICLLSDHVRHAQELLTRVELECAKVGLRLNAKKTEVIAYNIPQEHLPLTTTEGTALKEVTDFKYLGAWVGSTEKDLKVRKALSWRALNGMTSVWKSNLPRHIKISFFSATVESVLLYGCECWTLTQALQKSLDGCYTRMLRVVLNINQDEHITNKRLYGELPSVSEKIAVRRMRLAGHCHRHQELPVKRLVLWEPAHGHRSRGRPTPTYVDVLKKDAGAESTNELARCMENRDDWKRRWRARLRTT